MKKIVLILLLFILTIPIMTGCGNENNFSEIESTSLQSTENDDVSESTEDSCESTSSVTAEPGTFDWDTAMSKTTLLGEPIPMPFSMNDLGENYRLGEISNALFGEHGCGANLWCTAYIHPDTGRTVEKMLGHVSFDNVFADEYTDDCKISYVSYIDDLSIQGIHEDVPIELVYDTWGEPHEIINTVSYYYGDADCSKAIIIYTDDNNCVSTMNVNFEYEKDEADDAPEGNAVTQTGTFDWDTVIS